MLVLERILAIPEQSIDYLQMGISGGERAALKDRGFVRKDGTKAKDYMIRTIQKTEKNKAKAEKAVIKGDKKLAESAIAGQPNWYRKGLKNAAKESDKAYDAAWRNRDSGKGRYSLEPSFFDQKNDKNTKGKEVYYLSGGEYQKGEIISIGRDVGRNSLKKSDLTGTTKIKTASGNIVKLNDDLLDAQKIGKSDLASLNQSAKNTKQAFKLARLTKTRENVANKGKAKASTQDKRVASLGKAKAIDLVNKIRSSDKDRRSPSPDRTTTKSNRGLEVTYNKKGDLSTAAPDTAKKIKGAIAGVKGGKVVKGVSPRDRGIPPVASSFIKGNSKNHTVFYNGKVVNMDYLGKKPRDEFKFAGMRIADNLSTSGVGFIKTPKGEYYQVSNANRSAKKVSEKEVLDSVRQSKPKQPSAIAKKLGLTAEKEADILKRLKKY